MMVVIVVMLVMMVAIVIAMVMRLMMVMLVMMMLMRCYANVDIAAQDAALIGLSDDQLKFAGHRQRAQRIAQPLFIPAGVEQRPKHHVSAGAAETVEIQYLHGVPPITC